jgi:hypothetical protein
MAIFTALAGPASSGTSALTILQLRGTTVKKTKLIAWYVGFAGVTSTDAPIPVSLVRQSTDGTASGITESKFDIDEAAAAVTAFNTFTSTMPATSETLELAYAHPQGGFILREYPPGREVIIDDIATSRLGITITAAVAVNFVAWMQWEE